MYKPAGCVSGCGLSHREEPMARGQSVRRPRGERGDTFPEPWDTQAGPCHTGEWRLLNVTVTFNTKPGFVL